MFSSRLLPLPHVSRGGGLGERLWDGVRIIPARGEHPQPRLSQTCGCSPRPPQRVLINPPAPNAVPQPAAPRAEPHPKYRPVPKLCPAAPAGIPARRHLCSHPPRCRRQGGPLTPNPRGAVSQDAERRGCSTEDAAVPGDAAGHPNTGPGQPKVAPRRGLP